MSSDGNSLESRIENVRRRVRDATERSGRSLGSVCLIGASKKQTIEILCASVQAGHCVFGENYVQELVEKKKHLPEAEWHFIGALQRNKARKVVGLVETIQSVDRISLAKTINEIAAELRVVQKILVQVNIGDESSKGGVSEGQFEELLNGLASLENLEVRGLMALPPLAENPDVQRENFARCREKLREIQSRFPQANELSMGTTGDFELAIEEGATMVRVGTALFGPRAN